MTKQEYSTLIAQMSATIYAGGFNYKAAHVTAGIAVGAALELARLSGIEEPKE